MPRGVRIGLKDVYYALLDSDEVDVGAEYLTPVRLVGAITANINPNSSMETLFADDGPMEVATALGDIELELTLADLPLPAQAVLLGHTYAGGHLVKKSDDIAPWVALGFRALKSNGNYRYVWLLKGRFMIPEESHETKADSIDFQTPTINGSFTLREYDGQYMISGDEDETDFFPIMAEEWFEEDTLLANPATVTVDVSTATPTVNVAFDIEFTGAKDETGAFIVGATDMRVFSTSGQDLSAIVSVILDAAGDGDKAITLTTEGVQLLAVQLDGVPWWQVIEVDVQPAP